MGPNTPEVVTAERMRSGAPPAIPATAQVVTITTPDGVSLDGLIYEPTSNNSNRSVAILHIHGMGGNFYSGPVRAIPSLFPDRTVAHLALNLRSHDLGYVRADVATANVRSDGQILGGMWERLDESGIDIAAGVGFLKQKGYQDVFLLGHSMGGFHAASYAATEDTFAGLILLSPLLSTHPILSLWFGDSAELQEIVRVARDMVAAGHGNSLLTMDHWYYGISALSLLDRVEKPDESWKLWVDSLQMPVLMIWGSLESRDAAWRAAFDEMKVLKKNSLVIDGADHHYYGHETTVSEAVSSFVSAVSTS